MQALSMLQVTLWMSTLSASILWQRDPFHASEEKLRNAEG
jgi:hypothetical protein